MFFTLHDTLFLFVAIATGYRLFKRDFPVEARQGIDGVRRGIDAFLLKARDTELSMRARRLKRTIAKKVEAAAQAAAS